MEDICNIRERYGKEWVMFEEKFDNNLTPEILEFISNYQRLYFGFFNKSVDNLPNSITHIEFGGYFNQPVNNLPNSVVNIWLGWSFNHPLDNLPESLTDLKITGQFDHPIDNLPPNLKYLQVGFYFNQPIYNLPVNLKMFDISCFSYDYQNLIDKNILEKFNVQKKELKTILVNKTF